jgi:hypothetical protein
MKKEVSIVLSVERRDYRKLAQKWYGLTDEQMIDMDVHHNPARHDGGRDIPEHLYVYHNTLHSAVHDDEFVLWAREGAAAVKNRNTGPGGKASCAQMKETQTGFFDPKHKPFRSEWSSRAGQSTVQRNRETGAWPGLGTSPEAASAAGKKAAAQRWRCLETGHISSAGPLTIFQRRRGIDTSLRERLE